MRYPCGAVHDEHEVHWQCSAKTECGLSQWQSMLFLLVLFLIFATPLIILLSI
jgi:hypothetical protein